MHDEQYEARKPLYGGDGGYQGGRSATRKIYTQLFCNFNCNKLPLNHPVKLVIFPKTYCIINIKKSIRAGD